MIRSLFSKILISHLVALIITTASIGFLLSHLVTNYLIEAKRAELIREGTVTVAFIDSALQDKKILLPLLENLSELSGTTLWIMDNNSRITSGKAPQGWHHRMKQRKHNMHAEDTDIVEGEVKSWVYRSRNDEDPSIVAAIPFPTTPNTILFLHTPITGIANTSAAIQQLLFYASLGSILLAGLFALFLSRSLTKPIRNISQTAARFAGGDYSARTTAAGSDEIGKLGLTFNEMAESLTRNEKNRREFFSDVTHELKTPIAAVQAVTESLLDGIVTDDITRNRYLKTILNETKHMNGLISDLLNLAQLDSGQVQFHYQTLTLTEFGEQQQLKYQSLLAEKNQQLTFSTPPEVASIQTDPLRLEQILANLISNASRHSPENALIHLEITAEPGAVSFAVVDHGEGIPTAELPYIWDRFYRIDKSRARSKGGTGLGLSITKKLAEGMGGTIMVASVPNQQTTFWVKLPQN